MAKRGGGQVGEDGGRLTLQIISCHRLSPSDLLSSPCRPSCPCLNLLVRVGGQLRERERGGGGWNSHSSLDGADFILSSPFLFSMMRREEVGSREDGGQAGDAVSRRQSSMKARTMADDGQHPTATPKCPRGFISLGGRRLTWP